jgi:TatD DNase family protein
VIDTHTHLNDPRFSADSDEVRACARQAGVNLLLVVGYDLPSSSSALALALRYGDAATVGVHPHDAQTFEAAAVDRLRELASAPQVVAIGETGLDYHYGFSSRNSQCEAFRIHIRLAKQLNLPLVVHCREAFDDLCSIMKEEEASAVGGVVHCFTGGVDDAHRVVEMGFYLGVSGVITFPKSDAIRDALASVPAERLMLETDCPYMAPQPVRGKRCEPAHIVYTARKLAELRGVSVEEVLQLSDSNARKCFPRLQTLLAPPPHGGCLKPSACTDAHSGNSSARVDKTANGG